MDFNFTDDQLSIQTIARDFAQKRIAPIAAEFDQSGQFPLETIREMGQLGLMGIEVPHEYGGAGMDTIAYALAKAGVNIITQYSDHANRLILVVDDPAKADSVTSDWA